MKKALPKKAIRGIGLLLCLCLSYLLCRFVFFDIHGMKQWVDILAGFSLVVLLISLLLKLRWMSVLTACGYMAGFVLGLLFSTDGFDPGGGRTNNFWVLWAAGVLICMLIGIAVDMAVRIRKKLSRAQ